eukprot:Lithocolla_globosa_v1_NODE_355_length_4341_cov_25.771815.p3 type:complete len:125 gc:universal NODE_355_length_4341_cov_25.771815:410-784(+)
MKTVLMMIVHSVPSYHHLKKVISILDHQLHEENCKDWKKILLRFLLLIKRKSFLNSSQMWSGMDGLILKLVRFLILLALFVWIFLHCANVSVELAPTPSLVAHIARRTETSGPTSQLVLGDTTN